MREPIKNEQAADVRGVSIKTSEREQPAEKKRLTNEYEGYRIYETFDPNGPTFKDCIIRVFTVAG